MRAVEGAEGTTSMLGDLIDDSKGELIETLTSKLGLPEGKAIDFLREALAKLQGMFAGGDLNVAKLLGSGSGESLASVLDLGSIAGLVGGDQGKAQAGVGAVLDTLKGKLTGADDPEGLLGSAMSGLDQDGDGLDAGDIMGGLKKLF